MKKDLIKTDLYEAVKTLVEYEKTQPHIHLTQQKLFTLYSIAFQYLLFKSTKEPGAYIIRIEDSQFADKITRRAKETSSSRFLQTLLLPRKHKYDKSTFYLDFFNLGSWKITNDIPKDRIRAALVVKNTSSKPIDDTLTMMSEGEDEISKENEIILKNLPENYYYGSLQEFVPKTIVIAFEKDYKDTHKIAFPFIKKEQKKTLSGVTLSGELDWDNLE